MDKPINKLIEVLREESEKIELLLQIARVEGRGTPQEIADRRENVIRSIFEKYFPFPYKVTKGNIIDVDGNKSSSIDCVILQEDHPNTIDPYTKLASVILADSVYCAIEIKYSLNGKELINGLNQISSIKRLQLSVAGDLAKMLSVPTVLFAQKTYNDFKTLLKNIKEHYKVNNVPEREQFDILYIHNRGIVFNMKRYTGINLGNLNSNSKSQQILYGETGKDSFGFLLHFIINMADFRGNQGNFNLNQYLLKLPKFTIRNIDEVPE